MIFHKRWSLAHGRIIWGTYTFVTSRDGLTKGVVLHKGGLSLLLYMHALTNILSCLMQYSSGSFQTNRNCQY